MGNKNSTGDADFATSSSTMVSHGEDENKERGNWSGKLDFILSCLGYAVGLGNVWRFPYLAYTYGGAIFLIPYFISLLLIGLPIFLMELSLGQFTSSGPLTCWKMSPIFQGVGAAMLVISCVLAVYYNMIIGWSIYYLAASFSALPGLPWQYCDQTWATPYCGDYIWKNISVSPLNCSMAVAYNDSLQGNYLPFSNGLCIGVLDNETDASWFTPVSNVSEEGSFLYKGSAHVWADVPNTNYTYGKEAFSESLVDFHTYPLPGSNFTKGLVGFWNTSLAGENNLTRKGPSEEYFTRRVLRQHESTGLLDLGTVHWDLVLCLLAAWVIVFLCLIKGIKSSGKVVYFTALFPYLILLILMVRGALMDGSLEGVLYYLRGYGTKDVPDDIPKFYREKLSNTEVWRRAAEQIFFSLSACYGGLIALSSYNRFNNNLFRDTLIVTFGNCLTSFFAGFVIFSFLGALAAKLDVLVSEVADSGIGLAFIVYPEAVTHIPPAPLWAILFFIMLLTLGLDSEFALMETLLTSCIDAFPQLRKYKTPCIAALCFIFFLFGLSLCTSGGIYVLVLLDTFGAGWNVLLIAVLECIAIAWVYSIIPHLTGSAKGAHLRFVNDIQTMLGSDYVLGCVPWSALRWLWVAMWAVVTPLICFVLMILALVDYGSKPPLQEGDYVFEPGFIVLGWLITALILTLIVGGGIRALHDNDWCFKQATAPSRYWGPALPEHRKLCDHHPDMEDDPWDKEVEMSESHSKSRL